MLTIARKRREAERHKKLDDAFQKADIDGTGKLTKEQMIKCFEVNDVVLPNLEEDIAKLAGKDGLITLSEFKKFTMPTDLCKIEFHDRVFQKVEYDKAENTATGPSAKKDSKAKAEALKQMDRVELAFRKFDANRDGFLSRAEFDEMMKDVEKEQADRIFRACDQAGDGRVSLEEFRNVIQRGKTMMKN
ncbi:hypothetical protein TCAL_15024 [Tigriopus californicus]|uniref:EF-hand domain-containing protein n=1 Tax=Tigriopus californicus TaxID=6832 RepID=A0A553NXA2_TIGCA|nr:calmodulin-like [Tigriopus californicus]TRY70065.1 hypothetical protein TCAL_15024 [Tigriopus californicus]